MDDFNWICPHCERAVTITQRRHSEHQHILRIQNAEGRQALLTQFIVCPNPECTRFSLSARLFESEAMPNSIEDRLVRELKQWSLVPSSAAKHFPDYIPQAIRNDYLEACLIRDLSPKASATLSRRCLQGILRDFWKVKAGRLLDEIEAVKKDIDPVIWDAINAVRKLGNIGAHMEKDINVIVDVDPEEATQLILLVETLLEEWYVARENRKNRMTAVKDAAANKKAP